MSTKVGKKIEMYTNPSLKNLKSVTQKLFG